MTFLELSRNVFSEKLKAVATGVATDVVSEKRSGLFKRVSVGNVFEMTQDAKFETDADRMTIDGNYMQEQNRNLSYSREIKIISKAKNVAAKNAMD